MFTTPCYIKVTDEAQRRRVVEFLEKIGYEPFCLTHEGEYPTFIYTEVLEKRPSYYSDADSVSERQYDCGENEELFMALAALRDGSDKHQWFVFTELFLGDCHVFHTGDMIHYDEVAQMFTEFEQPMYVRKATPAELVAHFTNQ